MLVKIVVLLATYMYVRVLNDQVDYSTLMRTCMRKRTVLTPSLPLELGRLRGQVHYQFPC